MARLMEIFIATAIRILTIANSRYLTQLETVSLNQITCDKVDYAYRHNRNYQADETVS